MLLLVSPPAEASSFVDLSDSYWAYEAITTLEREGVAHGYPYDWREVRRGVVPTLAYFYPRRPITRAQLTVMLAKTFDVTPVHPKEPSYRDVAKTMTLYGWIRAYDLIEGARAEGIIPYTANWFLPDLYVERQDAVDSLIRSLGLGDYARGLPNQEVAAILAPYRDDYRVDPSYRPSMATAVRFGIIEGYEDGTLRPDRSLSRAEAAAIIYRSCLVDAMARPSGFTPDGDGHLDWTAIRLRSLRNSNISSWALWIESYGGYTFRSWSGSGPRPPDEVLWEGMDDTGSILPPAVYYYRARYTDRTGREFTTVRKPLRVYLNHLSAEADPPSGKAGATFKVHAWTDESGKNVWVETPSGRAWLHRHASSWQTTVKVPSTRKPGPLYLPVTALFEDGARKTVFVSFLVQSDRINLAGDLRPNPARAGDRVLVSARTTGKVNDVSASTPWGDLHLARLDDGLWEGRFTLPLATPEGVYPVELTASGPRGTARESLYLIVTGSVTEDFRFSLTG